MDQAVFADENLLSTVGARRTLHQVIGGVLIPDKKGVLVSAIGDTSDRDEKCAVHGVETAGLKADMGD